jgi:hypothetical protein
MPVCVRGSTYDDDDDDDDDDDEEDDDVQILNRDFEHDETKTSIYSLTTVSETRV